MLTLTLESDTDEDISALYRWLLDDDTVRRTASLELSESTQQPGAMGGAFDIINLVVTSGFSAANLAIAFATWKEAHAKVAKLVLRNGEKSTVIEGASQAEIASILEILSDGKSP